MFGVSLVAAALFWPISILSMEQTAIRSAEELSKTIKEHIKPLPSDPLSLKDLCIEKCLEFASDPKFSDRLLRVPKQLSERIELIYRKKHAVALIEIFGDSFKPKIIMLKETVLAHECILRFNFVFTSNDEYLICQQTGPIVRIFQFRQNKMIELKSIQGLFTLSTNKRYMAVTDNKKLEVYTFPDLHLLFVVTLPIDGMDHNSDKAWFVMFDPAGQFELFGNLFDQTGAETADFARYEAFEKKVDLPNNKEWYMCSLFTLAPLLLWLPRLEGDPEQPCNWFTLSKEMKDIIYEYVKLNFPDDLGGLTVCAKRHPAPPSLLARKEISKRIRTNFHDFLEGEKRLIDFQMCSRNVRYALFFKSIVGACALLDLYKTSNDIKLLEACESFQRKHDTVSNINAAALSPDGSLALTIKNNDDVPSWNQRLDPIHDSDRYLLTGDITIRLHNIAKKTSVVIQHGEPLDQFSETGELLHCYKAVPKIEHCRFSSDSTSFFICKSSNDGDHSIEFYDFAELASNLTLYQLHCILNYGSTPPTAENRRKVAGLKYDLAVEDWLAIKNFFNEKWYYRLHREAIPLL